MKLSMKMIVVPLAMLAVALTAAAQEKPATLTIDPSHSSVTFRVRHLLNKVDGRFDEFSGTITGDPKKPESAAVAFTIKAASIDTRVEKRDAHLRSADFFDVEKFPEITFKSTRITSRGGDAYDVAGVLTMHGVSKDVVLPVSFLGEIKDPWGKTRAGFTLSMTLNRKDFGINWNKALDQGGLMLGDDVDVTIDLQAVRE
jgi:polyisoprenoid-binding protein YceI